MQNHLQNLIKQTKKAEWWYKADIPPPSGQYSPDISYLVWFCLVPAGLLLEIPAQQYQAETQENRKHQTPYYKRTKAFLFFSYPEFRHTSAYNLCQKSTDTHTKRALLRTASCNRFVELHHKVNNLISYFHLWQVLSRRVYQATIGLKSFLLMMYITYHVEKEHIRH